MYIFFWLFNQTDLIYYSFFFQAEDGIRDATVTGVQTCALPIWRRHELHAGAGGHQGHDRAPERDLGPAAPALRRRVPPRRAGGLMVKEELARFLERALDRCARDGLLPAGERPPVQLDAPKNPAHGDFASNAAMVLQKQHAQATGAAKPSPRALAQAIVDRIEDPDGILEKVEIAGPGFLNLRLRPAVWYRAFGVVWQERERFGRSAAGGRRKTMVEFVSANPTGPMHVGHGRGAVIGDTVANLLDRAGCEVAREFYVTDAGGQVFRLAHAVFARATELDGTVPVTPLDPDDYQGDYVKDVARAWLATRPDLRKSFLELREPLRKFATGWILDHLIKPDLELFGIRFDRFFSETTLHDRGAIAHAVEMLRGKGVLAEEVLPPPQGVERDADEEVTAKPLLVMKTTRFGDDRDRPIYKTTGEPTYFAADLAYHFDKLERGYQRLIDVWGADHAGYVRRMKAAVGAMGGDLEVLILQLVDLLKRVLQFPELVAAAAQALEPHRVVFYLQETIAAFHAYYTKYKKTERVISDDPRKTAARLYLVWAIKQTLANALTVLGVSAPERMEEAEKEPEGG